MPFKDAVEKGATALFGEKYGDEVRFIKFGNSMELCGGTHVKNTNEIQLFHIKNESSVASGIRRIEAITGEKARQYFSDLLEKYQAVCSVLQNVEEPIKAIQNLQEENQLIKKQLSVFIREKGNVEKSIWINAIQKINNLNFLAVSTEIDNASVKDISFNLRKEIDNLFLVVVSINNQIPTISVALSDSLVANNQLNASAIVKKLAIEINGGGGGQPFFATAGGKNLSGVENVIKQAKIIALEQQ